MESEGEGSHSFSYRIPLRRLRQQNLLGPQSECRGTGSITLHKENGTSCSLHRSSVGGGDYDLSESHSDVGSDGGEWSPLRRSRGEENGGSDNESFEEHIFRELSDIRDKLKEQSQWLAEQEKHLQLQRGELEEREEGVEGGERALREREEGVEGRERALREREEGMEVRERALREREEKVQQLERLACEAHDALTRCIEQEVAGRLQELREHSETELSKVNMELREKARENQRLRNSFETIKLANDGLRKQRGTLPHREAILQLQEVSERNSQLEVQIGSIQSRLTNLQRRSKYAEVKQQQQSVVSNELARGSTRLESKPQPPKGRRAGGLSKGYCELLGTALGWLCQVHLSQPLNSDQLPPVRQWCGQALPLLAELLPQLASSREALQLPYLEFTYWAVSLLQQRSTLASTLRRIGEEVYKPVAPNSSMDRDTALKPVRAFFRSPDLHIRILSSLVVLKTLTQVDCLAHVFDALRQDLKEDMGKELFLAYRGVEGVLPFMSPAHKALCGPAVDLHLQLAVESAVLPHFLAACSSSEWFAASAALLQENRTIDRGVLEKLSIILQRLSKHRANRRLFESSRLTPLIQEVLRSHSDPDNPFLALNLQSILINLTSR